MSNESERLQAQQALAEVARRREQVHRAARVPWWFYVVVFALVVAVTTFADDLSAALGAKVVPVVAILAVLVALVVNHRRKRSPIGIARGVDRRRRFSPLFLVSAIVVWAVAAGLMSDVGPEVAGRLAGAIGVPGQYHLVLGVLLGAVLVVLMAAGVAVDGVVQRRTTR